MSVARYLAAGAIALGILAGSAQAIELRPLPKATVQISVQGKQSQLQKQLVTAINQQRKAAGLKTLKMNSKLSRTAQAHADDMIRRGYFGHVAPNGSKPLARTQKAGYKGCLVAENLSYSWKTVDQAMAGWMKSSGHRYNMLHRDMREVGIGVGPNNLFVAVFAKPC